MAIEAKCCRFCGQTFVPKFDTHYFCSADCYKLSNRATEIAVEPLDGEIWKPVVGYEGIYEVSNVGRIKSLQRIVHHDKCKTKYCSERIMRFDVNYGYNIVSIRINKKYKRVRVHRMVAEAFIPNPEEKPCVNHINGIKTDNRVENLEWCTDKENMEHAAANQLTSKGQSHYKAKLTDEQVVSIFKRVKGGEQGAEVAREFKVSPTAINLITQRKTWKHLTDTL